MRGPIPGEKPQTNWPTVEIGEHKLVVRWSLFTQYILSKRGIDPRKLPALAATMDPTLVSVMFECFAAAVAQNYESNPPDADYWAREISIRAEVEEGIFSKVNQSIWQAIARSAGKDMPAVQPAEPQTATQPETTN